MHSHQMSHISYLRLSGSICFARFSLLWNVIELVGKTSEVSDPLYSKAGS